MLRPRIGPHRRWLLSFHGGRCLAGQQTRSLATGSGTVEEGPLSDTIFSQQYRDIKLSGGPIRVYEHGPTVRKPDEDDTKNNNHDTHLTTQPPVLLLHGPMNDTAAFAWRHLMPSRLSAHRRVFAIDLPRHGGSRPWPAKPPLTQARLESALTELLDNLNIPRISLIGHAMGAGLAIGYTLSHPSRISALATINPDGVIDRVPAQFYSWLTGLLSPLPTPAKALQNPKAARYLRDHLVQHLQAGSRTRDFTTLLDLADAEVREKAKHGEKYLDDWQIAMLGPFGMRVNFMPRLGELGEAGVPSLWVVGEEVGPSARRLFREAATRAGSNARFVSIRDASHHAMLDQPERVCEEVTGFLESVGC